MPTPEEMDKLKETLIDAPEGDEGAETAAQELEAAKENEEEVAEETEVEEEEITEEDDEEVAESDEEAEEEEQVVLEAPEEEAVKDTDNADRSKLGREVAKLKGSNEEILALLRDLKQGNAQSEEDNYLDEIDDDTPLTKGELRKLQEREAKRVSDSRNDYNNGYFGGVNKIEDALGDKQEDLDHYDKVIALMNKEFNIKHSNNGAADIERNYNAAENKILRMELAESKAIGKKKVVKLKNSKKKVPTGVGGSSKSSSSTKTSKPVDVSDPHVAGIVKYYRSKGMSEEDIAKKINNL